MSGSAELMDCRENNSLRRERDRSARRRAGRLAHGNAVGE